MVEVLNDWADLTLLLQFDASLNNFTGKLPTTLADLHLQSLAVNDNQLEGEIPTVLSSNPKLTELKLFNNKLCRSFSSEESISVVQMRSDGFTRKGFPVIDAASVCDNCGDARFLPCPNCSGSKKVFEEEGRSNRCPNCNENG